MHLGPPRVRSAQVGAPLWYQAPTPENPQAQVSFRLREKLGVCYNEPTNATLAIRQPEVTGHSGVTALAH